jgi:hypothetical protein
MANLLKLLFLFCALGFIMPVHGDGGDFQNQVQTEFNIPVDVGEFQVVEISLNGQISLPQNFEIVEIVNPENLKKGVLVYIGNKQ